VIEKRARPAAGYLVRHWRGDLSLGVSYWVNCLVVSVAAQIGVYLSVWLSIPIVLVMFLSFVVLTCWQVVGTWRSAQKHAGHGGTPAVALLAKVVMVIWVLAAANSLATKWVPLGTDIWEGIRFEKAMPACQVRTLPGGKAVEIAGGLPPGSAAKLAEVLKATPQATVVYVNSIGGLVVEGQKAGQMIREQGLSTYTEGCASAATLIFISGKERTIKEGAKIGFHAPKGYGMWAHEKTIDDSMTRETMTEAGVSQDFINRVMATPTEKLWFPTVDEMRRANVITKEDAPMKMLASSMLSIMDNPTNSESFVQTKTGHDDIDQLMGALGAFVGRWRRLFADMSAELDEAGEAKLYADETLRVELALRDAIAVEQKRQRIIERYRAKAQQEVQIEKSNLAVMKFSEKSAVWMLDGITNSIESLSPTGKSS
jgi:ATP-dependent protease ClpP protease subunit